MKKVLFSLLCCAVAVGCARLDNNLFAPTKVSAYLLDDYTGEVDFRLDASFDIAPNMINAVDLHSYDGNETATIKAFYVGDPSRIAIDTVILYCHGNRDHMDFYWPRVKLLANAGGKHHYGVMMLDYRGYGMSEGTPGETGLYADVDAAMAWLAAQGLSGDRLVLYGFSMGTAPAVELSAHPRSLKPGKLILEAPFASSEVMVQDSALLAIPGSYATNLKIANAESIKYVNQPLLWLHGTADDFLSMATHGEVVYKNHPGSEGIDKWPVRVPGARHDDVPQVIGFVNYMNQIVAFAQ